MRNIFRGISFLVAVAVLSACSTGSDKGTSDVSSSPESQNTITVFAASSLTKSFTEIGKQFEAANPGTKVVFSFAASSTLAEQINSGAPADVFASASEKSMDSVSALIPNSKVFAVNRVVVAYPVAKPLKAIADLNNPAIKWVQCDHQVPCGTAADAALTADGVTGTPVSLEPDAKSVTGKLTALEVDAAIIYATDVMSAGQDYASIEFSNREKASSNYPIGVTLSAKANAQAFVDFVFSVEGRKTLGQAGFGGLYHGG
jgi:molybdate transport system substrate-binding protein